MDDTEFDRALIGSAFDLIARKGWSRLSVAEAAREAALPLDRARARFPMRAAVLMRFGVLADQAALTGSAEGPTRDRLFDLIMRRIDVLQAHRAGVIALLRALPTDPATALLLTAATMRSMGWLLEAAGVSASAPLGRVRTKGLLGVWLWTIRAWQRDESPDLPATMAALDVALSRAERLAGCLPGGTSRAAPEASPEPPPDDLPLPFPDNPPDRPTPPPV
jgi:ubiquinone biosynthesis protein COQ9